MSRPKILDRLRGVRKSGNGWLAFCSAHDDQRKRSLSVGLGDDGGTVVHCFVGCPAERVCAAVGMTLADLAPPPRGADRESRPDIVATYDYLDESRTRLYQVVRYEPKDFRPRRPDGPGGWIGNLHGVRRVVYRLPDLVEARRIFFVEGEKDADRLWSLGLPATTTQGGANAWAGSAQTYARQLVEAAILEVVVIPDHDRPGHGYGSTVAHSLQAAGLRVRWLELPDLGPIQDKHGRDVSDWLDAGHTAADLLALADAAPPVRPDAPPDATGPPRPSTPAATFRPAAEVMEDPPPVAVVAGVAWRRCVTVVVSESGAGKTFVLLDLSAAITAERPWHGRAVRAGSVAYVSFEGDALGLRLRALREGGTALHHLHVLQAGEPLSPRVERDGTESPSAGETALRDALAALTARCADAGAPPLALLVVDTVRASLVGSEDGSADVAAYLRAIRRLLAPYPEAGAILAHHAGWQDGETKRKRERGSSAFRGNVDGTLYLEVTDENLELGVAALTLTALKVRDDAPPAPLRLFRTRVTLPTLDLTGQPERTCRIEPDPRSRQELADEQARVAQQAAAALDDRAYALIAPGRITSVRALRHLLGVKYDEANAALARLIQAGRVQMPGRKREAYLAMAPNDTE